MRKFIDELGSKTPTPGGGSVAALVAALAGSLNKMVYSYTKETDKELEKECNIFIEECYNLIEEDKKAFLNLMKSYKTKENLKENKIKAAAVPLKLIHLCYDFYSNIEYMIKKGNKNLLSDCRCATILLHSAIELGIENVKANTHRYDEEIAEIKVKSELTKNKILQFNKEDI